jgi:ribosomal protein S18 acetylase RimI-like enzyme
MPLLIRPPAASEYSFIEQMVIDGFEPITWQKGLDAKVGPLNGRDWRQRWQARMRHIFQTQIVLVGEVEGAICAMASGTADCESALGFIDVLAVSRAAQGRGCGREMLRGMIAHFKSLGMQYVHLDCLTNNDGANALYASEGFEEVARHIRWFRRI